MTVQSLIEHAESAARGHRLVAASHGTPFQGVSADTTVVQYMKPLQTLLHQAGVTEVCVNRPGIAFVEASGKWTRIEVPELTFKHCRSLAGAVATLSGQHTSETAPLLGAQLPGGERVQFVQPCAVPAGTIAVCIRKPASFRPSLKVFDESGLFKRIRPIGKELEAWEEELVALNEQGRYAEFFAKAVRRNRTIVVAGKTGSGKTTFMKALVEEVPLHERLIGIEDAAENDFPSHENKLNLFYSKNSQGASDVSAKQLLEACLRLRPDRIFLSEIRGEEAYYFLRLAASGHPGSITSLHAGSCELAFDQMSLMVRESPAGGGMTMPEIKQFARDVVDVVVHFDNDSGGRHITGIHYDPRARFHRLAA